MKVFNNTNGNRYEIIDDTHDEYTLVKELKEEYAPYDEPYIVAFDLDIERGSWMQGFYHQTLEAAERKLKQKTS